MFFWQNIENVHVGTRRRERCQVRKVCKKTSEICAGQSSMQGYVPNRARCKEWGGGLFSFWPSFLYMWATHVNENNRTSLDLHNHFCKLNRNKKFISSVLSMWPTSASEKNQTLFEPPEPPSKLTKTKVCF